MVDDIMPLHRTQVLLEEEQYHALRDRAAAEGISLSELLRRLVALHLGNRAGVRNLDPLRALRGSARGGGWSGEDHDELLYGGGDS